MDMRYVGLSEIDLDDRGFEVRSYSDSAWLMDSLGRSGMLDPVWVLEKSGKYVVVDGFKRLGWVRRGGVKGAFCRIFPEGCDVREVWFQRIEKKLFEGEINPAEKAQILAVLAEFFGPGEIPGFFLFGLKVANRAEAVKRWVQLSKKGPKLLEALGSGEVCERAAVELADWDEDGLGLVLSVLRTLRCSASIQVELVERIKEIAIREGKGCAEVLELERIGRIVSSEDFNHREKTSALREYLFELRNPRISLRRKRFQEDIAVLGLPRGVRVAPPEAFEGGEWRMEFSFTRAQELREIFRAAGPLVESDRLDAILGKR